MSKHVWLFGAGFNVILSLVQMATGGPHGVDFMVAAIVHLGIADIKGALE